MSNRETKPTRPRSRLILSVSTSVLRHVKLKPSLIPSPEQVRQDPQPSWMGVISSDLNATRNTTQRPASDSESSHV